MKVDPRSFKGLSRFLAPSAGGPVADRAVADHLVTPEQLQECIAEQDRSGRPLDQILIERGYLKAEDAERLKAPPLPIDVIPWLQVPDRLLGHYVLVSLLGTGGMAEVWKAWDRSLGRWVAVKYLKGEIGHPTQRIEREGRMAGQLSHPSIITIFERGQQDNRPYLVMPFVDGTPPRAPLPARSAAQLALEVARALTHVHEAGVIHRDVKPANILVETGGRVVLADFGLAILDETATSQWAMSGTPEYASPEQVQGDRLDLRTDIYSLGATLYHLLAGKPPYSGSGPDEITAKILREDPPPLKGAPRALARTIRRAMARDRQKRYASSAEFARDLETWLEESRPGRGIRPAWIVLAVLALGISWGATVLILLQAQRQEEREVVLQSLLQANRKLSAAERRRADPGSNRLEVEMTAREALAEFSVALRASGGRDREAQLGLGACHEILGDLQKAQEAYQDAADLPGARSALAWLLARNLVEHRPGKDWGAAIRALPAAPPAVRLLAAGSWEDVLTQAASAQDSELGGLLQGYAAIQLRRWDAALQALARSLRLRPHDSDVLYYEGVAFWGKGDVLAAKAAWASALSEAASEWPLRAEAERRQALSHP